MRKVGAVKGSSAPSPVPPGSTSESAGGETMRRTGSGGYSKEYSQASGPRHPLSIPKRQDSTGMQRNDGPVPGTPIRAMGECASPFCQLQY